MLRPIFALLALASATTALADAVVLKTGERFVGEVSEEGDSWRIRSDRFPDGVVVKKADVKAVYPKPDAMLAKLDAAIGRARERYEAGKKAADPNSDMKAAVDLLFDPELEAGEGAEVYPDRRKDFSDRLTTIHELRKMARDGQSLKGPPVDPAPNPKPGPKPAPKPDPVPAPGPQSFTDRPTVWLAAPDGAAAADFEKAAKAMASRCEAFGYANVKAKTEAGADGVTRVRLDLEGGFTAAMVQTISVLGRYAAKTFEMRLYYFPSAGEKEQFVIPQDADVAGAKAPAGAKWLRRVRFNADGPDGPKEAALMRVSPVIGRTELLPPYKDKPDYAADFYVITEAAESRLKAALKAGGTFKCEVAVDDVVLVTDVTPQAKEHPKDGRVWWRHSFSEKERKVVDGYRTAAMPFSLRVVEGK